MGSAFFFLRCFKLAHICIQVTSLHRGVINKESITYFYPLLISPVELSYANREPNSYNHLGAFYVSCFARVCEIFTAVVGELQRGPHVVL